MPARKKHTGEVRTFTVRMPAKLLTTLRREARRLSYELDRTITPGDVVVKLLQRHMPAETPPPRSIEPGPPPLPEDEEEEPDPANPDDDPSCPANQYTPHEHLPREHRARGGWLPTPEQIAIRARQVRRTWNEQMRLKRRGIEGTRTDKRTGQLRGNLPHWTPPELPHPIED